MHESEIAARKVVESFIEGYNKRDRDAILNTLQFPHIRIASGRVAVANDPSAYHTGLGYLIKQEGWDRSTLDLAEIVQASNDKVHLKIEFSRYKAEGSKYVTHKALYVVTKVHDRWGIQFRSSFAP